MKRKRGHKKKSKKTHVEASNLAVDVAPDVVMGSSNDGSFDESDNESCEDDNGSVSDKKNDNDDKSDKNNGDDDCKANVGNTVVDKKSEMAVPTPPPRLVERGVTVRPDAYIQRPPPMAVYGRVKLKLKKTVKPQSPVPAPQPVVQSELQLTERSGGGVGVSDQGDAERQKVSVEKRGEVAGGGDGGGGSGEKLEEKRTGSGSAESKKLGGVGIKIVSSKGLKMSLSHGGNGKEGGGFRESPKSSTLSPPTVNEKESGEVEELSRSSTLSPPCVNEKESDEVEGLPKSSTLSPAGGTESGEIKVSPMKSSLSSLGGNVNANANVNESGDIKELPKSSSLSPAAGNGKESRGIQESPMSMTLTPPGGNGKESGEIMVSPKSTSLRPDENGKESGEFRISLKSTSSNPPVGNKESGKIRISPKGTSLSPPGGSVESGEIKVSPRGTSMPRGNGEESNQIRVSPKSVRLSSPGANGKTKSLSTSPPSGNGKESGGSRVLPEEEEQDEEELQEEKSKVLNKHELEASLEVIRKVMKMDAAEPFNVPVNPIELGIPDYFDVIDTPMDFGTIRNNLEQGAKYMDSEDVYKDVEYIWNNCFRYNNKGDYIVDLMKRVRKNFMKYWVGAGLYTEQTKKIGGVMDQPATSNYGKKVKRGKGFKLHKEYCMCAVCIMRRRRREREAREAQEAREAGLLPISPQIKSHQASLLEEYQQEGYSHGESPGDDTSRHMETFPDGDADTEMEDGERLDGDDEQKAEDDSIEFRDRSDRSGYMSDKSQWSDKGDTELYSNVEARFLYDGTGMMIEGQKQTSVQPGGQSSVNSQHRNELLEFERKRQRLRLLETFRDLENPMLSGLCGTLFPNNASSIWNGANSLFKCQRSYHCRSNIDEAVASFTTKSTSRK